MCILLYLLCLLVCLDSLNAWVSQLSKTLRSSYRQPASLASALVGRFHTEESKKKISIANKGRVPWNLGLRHTNETKRLIAIRTREAALQRKKDEAQAMGVTIEELKSVSAAKRKVLYEAKLKGGLSEEGRRAISDTIKARWNQPGYREEYSQRCAGTRSHSNETRARISDAIRRKWQDEDYRRRCLRTKVSPVTRNKISQRIKEKWMDPMYRQQMAVSHVRTPEWRANLAAAIREKWQDPSYRGAVSRSRGERIGEGRARRPAGSQLLPGGLPVVPLSREEAMRRARLAARLAARQNVSVDLRALLGPALWDEEKEYRRSLGEEVRDDATLNAVLLQAWGHAVAEGTGEAEAVLPVSLEDILQTVDVGAGSPGGTRARTGKGKGRRRTAGESGGARRGVAGGRGGEEGAERRYRSGDEVQGEAGVTADMDLDMDMDMDQEEDVIEEYDENGRLVGVYPAREFERRRAERELRASSTLRV